MTVGAHSRRMAAAQGLNRCIKRRQTGYRICMTESERYTGDDTFLPPDQKSPPGPLDGDETFVVPEPESTDPDGTDEPV